MENGLINELVLTAIKDMQESLREHSKALAELDKGLALVNLKIAMAAAASGGAVGIAQYLMR